ncbi:glycoside hydrolase [Algoriphagus oliviformis]|nr:glycoside hydrolase [Algoriphagus oliviformis]
MKNVSRMALLWAGIALGSWGIYACTTQAHPSPWTVEAKMEKSLSLENEVIKVDIDPKSGNFTVLEKKSGQSWTPDPWQNAAGILTFEDLEGKKQTANLSQSKTIQVLEESEGVVKIEFIDPLMEDQSVAEGIKIGVKLSLNPENKGLDISIEDLVSGDYALADLRYPARHFSLETDVDRGAAVIPQKQGVISPSYIFPMNGGRFCKWDDATYNNKSIGTLQLFNNGTGLSMPWWGTYNEKSAVMVILDEASRPDMFYNINNNGQYLFTPEGKMSTYQRRVFLDPVWNLKKENAVMKMSYRFIPGGDYVDMAKTYREEAKRKGFFVSLKDKAAANPNVNKLPGAIYMGIYGGYPHYVNMPGMQFTFEELKQIIQTTHDELGVQNAFVHAWGVFSNFPPVCWPINEDLGGTKVLREAVDLTKKYNWLYSSYHAYSPVLENDPNINIGLMQKDEKGKLQATNGRWARVDTDKLRSLASANLEKEIAALDLEADITDISFAVYPEKGSEGIRRLAEYLRSLNLVMGTEHGQEQWIPYFDMFEGLVYLEDAPLAEISHPAPLFSLVYHDAIANFGKIQDPNNEVTANGDYRIKSLQSMLFGIGSAIFFSPYEFDGMKEMLKMSNSLVSPVHRETFYAELESHEYLSADFKLQRSRFSTGTEVTVNLGPVAQKTNDGTSIPGYGYLVKLADGSVKKGGFQLSLTMN